MHQQIYNLQLESTSCRTFLFYLLYFIRFIEHKKTKINVVHAESLDNVTWSSQNEGLETFSVILDVCIYGATNRHRQCFQCVKCN